METEHNIRKIVEDIPRGGASSAGSRKELSEADLEALLATELEGDHLPHKPVRRNLEGKLNTLRRREERAAQRAAMTPKEIVDSIPRGEVW